jgi:hypothetical protein
VAAPSVVSGPAAIQNAADATTSGGTEWAMCGGSVGPTGSTVVGRRRLRPSHRPSGRSHRPVAKQLRALPVRARAVPRSEARLRAKPALEATNERPHSPAKQALPAHRVPDPGPVERAANAKSNPIGPGDGTAPAAEPDPFLWFVLAAILLATLAFAVLVQSRAAPAAGVLASLRTRVRSKGLSAKVDAGRPPPPGRAGHRGSSGGISYRDVERDDDRTGSGR